MTYPFDRRIAKQWASSMVPEEAEVWESLTQVGYRYLSFVSSSDIGAPTIWDFTAIRDLYEVYIKYRRSKGQPPNEDLTVQQFGIAFNAVTENTLTKARRWINILGVRKKAWGYLGVTGPKSHKTHLRSGRPRA